MHDISIIQELHETLQQKLDEHPGIDDYTGLDKNELQEVVEAPEIYLKIEVPPVIFKK